MGKTKISWTMQTWNTLVGCSPSGPECDNCYARIAANSPRLQQFPQYKGIENWDGTINYARNQLLKPFNFEKSQIFFVNSMGDTHHPKTVRDNLDEVYAVAALAREHTFQFLTKYPQSMKKYHEELSRERLYEAALRFWNDEKLPQRIHNRTSLWKYFQDAVFPLPNVWLGTSVGMQKSAWRAEVLRTVPAKVRFLSCEPLLERILLDLTDIHWVIVGGESGSGKDIRPTRVEDIRSLVRQCREQGASPFVKQLGRFPLENGCPVKLKSSKGENFDEFPPELSDLKVREYPVA